MYKPKNSAIIVVFWSLGASLLAADPAGTAASPGRPPTAQFGELSPPEVEFDATAPAVEPKLPGITASFTAVPAVSDQNIINELLDLRSRIGGVTGSTSRFQAELVRLIDADRERKADAGASLGSVANLSAAAVEPPKPNRVKAQPASESSEPPGSPRRTALQIAMYRALAEELDGLANQLEHEDSFTAADVLRQRSVQLREHARRLWTSFPDAREALRQLPTVAAAPSINLNSPAPAAASLPSVPVPIPDPPARQPKAKK
jgi:hypothetical protein